jgi:hypothetical protein
MTTPITQTPRPTHRAINPLIACRPVDANTA